jgi:hypothetical protein
VHDSRSKSIACIGQVHKCFEDNNYDEYANEKAMRKRHRRSLMGEIGYLKSQKSYTAPEKRKV